MVGVDGLGGHGLLRVFVMGGWRVCSTCGIERITMAQRFTG
jgi:hypothetical protein